jgi:scyllo-inositol 2-dehydrogenase (NADP+)
MRTAVVGLGNQGRKRRRIAGDAVVATVDPAATDADYRRLEDLPLDRFDTALVCTPDDQKLACLRYLLGHGKHVLVEKPLLGEPRDFDELATLVRANKAVLYTAYNHRFEPHLVRVKRLLDDGAIGTPYLVRLFYGNGTARDVRNSPWRDQGWGVVPDLGSHLLDLVDFFFGLKDRSFRAWSIDRFENRAPDHVLFGSVERPEVVCEATLLSWKNHFQLDIYGESGSTHVTGLCKWGPSVWSLRKRVLPSGRPTEETETLEMADPTWQSEYEHFVRLCETGGTGSSGRTNLDNDRAIQAALNQIVAAGEGASP